MRQTVEEKRCAVYTRKSTDERLGVGRRGRRSVRQGLQAVGSWYPGGPVLDKIAREYGTQNLISFPKGRPREGVSALSGLRADLFVSFSGLKPRCCATSRPIRI